MVAVAFAAVIAFNVNIGLSKNYLSDIALANIEALAKGEIPINGGGCDTCGDCSGHYYICLSEWDQLMNDLLNNCGPGSGITIEIWDFC